MYIKPIDLETMSLLMCLAFFDDTGPGDGKLTAADGANLTKGASLDLY